MLSSLLKFVPVCVLFDQELGVGLLEIFQFGNLLLDSSQDLFRSSVRLFHQCQLVDRLRDLFLYELFVGSESLDNRLHR